MRQLLTACLVCLALGCGGGTQLKTQAGPPLTADEQKVFDDGVDFVATLEGLEGRWREDWDRDLAVRVGGADLIALVTVRTLRTDTDPQQRVTYRLQLQLDRELVGNAPSREIELTVHAEEPGFRSVDENLGRLVDTQFMAYLRRGPDGMRWHLSPAADQVVVETESKITQLQRAPKDESRERVIVHTN